MSPYLAEFLGTMLLTLLGNGVVAGVLLKGSKAEGSGWLTVVLGWGLAVTLSIYAVGRISGAHLNPAVTIGLAVAGKFAWASVLSYIAAQMIGAMLGAFLVWLMYYDHFHRTNNPGSILAVFCTGPAVRKFTSNIASEIIGAFVLVFVIFYITGAELTPNKTPIGLGSVGAMPVALLVWVIGLSLGGTTGYAINPVRDIGPRIMHAILPIKSKGKSDWAYSWIPILGPVIGAVIAALLYLQLQ